MMPDGSWEITSKNHAGGENEDDEDDEDDAKSDEHQSHKIRE